MSGSGSLYQRVAVDAGVLADDGRGGKSRTWVEMWRGWGEFRYQHGQEATERGGLTGTASFKVRLLSTARTRAFIAEQRLRDRDRNIAFNIREVDPITDRTYVWLVVESGVAV